MNKPLLTVVTAAASLTALAVTASAQTGFGLTTTGTGLVSFDVNGSNLTGAVAFTNLQIGETITAIDFRPNNQLLYGYGSTNRLYTIATSGVNAGAATFVTAFGTTSVTPANGAGSDTPSPAVPAGAVSIDVNPNVPPGGTLGAVRIVSASGGNTRYTFPGNSPSDTLFQDDTLTFSGGGVPTVAGVAYTNNDTDPLTGTTLYYLEASTNSLYRSDTPNDGVLTLVGALGFDITTDVGFDVPLFGTTNAFASFNGNLYSVNLGTGAATQIGATGFLTGVADVAIPEPGTNAMLLLGGAGAFYMIRRRRVVS